MRVFLMTPEQVYSIRVLCFKPQRISSTSYGANGQRSGQISFQESQRYFNSKANS